MKSAIKHDVAFFDFLRGWSALFVFFHHASILGGGPRILSGELGQESVNVFMMTSGFLIYFQCSIGKTYHGLKTRSGVTNFYIRRFFRIAPAYYFCLVIALFLAGYLGNCREQIAQILPHTVTNMDRYYIAEPIHNFLIHASFVFGLIPLYSFSTPLPDWSLGLEMQFYLVFPLLFYFLKIRFAATLFFLLGTMFGVCVVLNHIGLHYPMPSFLPLKFHNFAAGIVLAHIYLKNENPKTFIFIAATTLLSLCVGNNSVYIPLLFLFAVWWTDSSNLHKNVIASVLQSVFQNKFTKHLSETSYSLYIFHLILMLPFFAFFLNGRKIGTMHWAALSLLLLFLTMGVSYLIYRFIEIPGISVGKRLIKPPAA